MGRREGVGWRVVEFGSSDPTVWAESLSSSSKETLGLAPAVATLLPRAGTQLY